MTNGTQSEGIPPSADRRTAQVRRVLLTVFAVNTLGVAVKLAIGLHTHSLAVLGAGLESGLDMLNNLVGMTVVSIAARGPDEDHPYGHAKFETIGAIGIVVFLSISCFELLRASVAGLVQTPAVHLATGAELLVMVGAVIANAGIVWYERRRGHALHSAFLLADAAHTGSDIFVTLLAIASLALTRAGMPRADALLGIAVALLIAWTGWRILRGSVPILVDARGMDADQLRRLAMSVPGITAVRAVRSRSTSSGKLFVEMTIVVSGASTVREAHALADQVELAVERAAGKSEVVVHVEPD